MKFKDCIVCFVVSALLLLGCNSKELQLRDNINFLDNLKIDGQSQNWLDSERLEHLQGVQPEDLERPIIFLLHMAVMPSLDSFGTIDVFWSEDEFCRYSLEININEKTLIKLSSGYDSELSSKMGREEHFDFAVHSASYPISQELYEKIVYDLSHGKNVDVNLKNEQAGVKSNSFSWGKIR